MFALLVYIQEGKSMRSAKRTILFLQALSSLYLLFVTASLLPAGAAISTDLKTAPTISDQTKAVRDWLVVPVFYATSRTFTGDKDNFKYSEEPNETGLLFGVKNIITPTPDNSPVSKDIRAKMLWQHIRLGQKVKEGTPDFDKNKCSVKDQLFSRDEIVPAFTAYMHDTGSTEVVIFVHGCCANYDTSMERAAKVAAHMQVPVMLYDWVSPKGFSRYLENETREQQTIDGFCKFLANATKIVSPENVILIGHSMGAQFVDGAMVRRADRMAENSSIPQFKEIILSNGDVDAKAFLNHIHEFASNAKKTRIYFSKNDDRLRMSAAAHGGFDRVGAPGALITDLVNSNTADFIDITANNTGHELPFWVVANLHKFNNLGPVKEFQLKEISPDLFQLTGNTSDVQSSKNAPIECACSK
jgi:esterase/lipase superfamily enzyme